MLTASGGPFRGRTREQLADVTPEQALAHPTWAMGPVITTNSATLVNKGLEVIEAHLLFDVAVRPDRGRRPPAVGRPLHGSSSSTGRCIAQCSPPDMRLPIALGAGLAATGPERPRRLRPRPGRRRWEFLPLDDAGVPGRPLARRVGSRAGRILRCTTRRTRCAWRRSSRAGSRSSTSWTS